MSGAENQSMSDIEPEQRGTTSEMINLNSEKKSTKAAPAGLGKSASKVVVDDGFGAKIVLGGSWTWMQLAQRIGGEQTVQRIISQSSTVGILAALLCAFAFTAISAPPSELTGKDGVSRAYVICMCVSALSCLVSVMVSAHIIIHINSIEWDTESVVRALEKNGSHLVISIVQGSLFLVGLIFLFIGICLLIKNLYDDVVFYVVIAVSVILALIGVHSIRTFSTSMFQTYLERASEQLEASKKDS